MKAKLERIQKIAHIARIVCKVLYIVCIVCLVIMLFGCLSFAFPAVFNIQFGDFSINSLIVDSADMAPTQFWGSAACTLIEFGCSAALLWLGERYLKHEISAGTPFTEAGSKELHIYGITVCVVSLAENMIVSVISYFTESKVEAEKTLIPVGILFIVASLIFDYGASVLNERKAEDAVINSALGETDK